MLLTLGASMSKNKISFQAQHTMDQIRDKQRKRERVRELKRLSPKEWKKRLEESLKDPKFLEKIKQLMLE